MFRTNLPRFIKNENDEELEIRQHLVIEEFKIEINLQTKSSEKYKNAS